MLNGTCQHTLVMKEREGLKKKTTSKCIQYLDSTWWNRILSEKHCVQKVQSITRCDPQPWAWMAFQQTKTIHIWRHIFMFSCFSSPLCCVELHNIIASIFPLLPFFQHTLWLIYTVNLHPLRRADDVSEECYSTW